MMDFSITLKPDNSQISEAIEFVESSLSKCNIKGNDMTKPLLLTEEHLVELVKVVPADNSITIKVRKFLGKTTITMQAKSTSPISVGTPDSNISFDGYESAPNAEAAIRSMIINANRDVLRHSYRNGTSTIVITAGESSHKNLMRVLFSMVLALVTCIIARLLLPASVCTFINDYIFITIKTIFLNALKTIIAPLIFFSIAASVSSITDLSEFGKIGIKVMAFYTFTTIVATIIALVAYGIINPGSFNELSYMAQGAEVTESQEMVSFLDTVIDIIPDNFLGAFVNSATLQLIFLGLLVGAVVPLMGDQREKIASFLSSANELFLRIGTVITKCLPIAVFAFIGSMVLTMDTTVIKTLLTVFICIILSMVAMMIFYLAVIAILTKSNPATFFKNALPAWLNAFALSSSNAAMTFTMNTCDKKLKISPKLYSFSIPLGATINMDGFVIVLTISFLFLAKAFGLELTGGDIFTLIITIILLSFGAPGIPGVSTICMSVLLMQYHIPMEALALFIGIDAIADPLCTANNVFGDIVGTFCIARRNGMVQD
jgi:Na+/H+-dicarboxylate symporter